MSARKKLVVVAYDEKTGITRAFGPVFSFGAAAALGDELAAAGWTSRPTGEPIVVLESVAEFRAERVS